MIDLLKRLRDKLRRKPQEVELKVWGDKRRRPLDPDDDDGWTRLF